ncbi:hypothetical protein [Streptomyces lydicus]|uniref:hypothetical protein n=1 Tax=Streptomyces lydicus TaxID=47763 RepID=UPI001011548D|nr:hypothetical protein [Streptomyces lydicus]
MAAACADALTAALAPRITPDGPGGELEGVAGLRQTARGGRLVELALWGGHGRLVLHVEEPPAPSPAAPAGCLRGPWAVGSRKLLLTEKLDPVEDAGRRSAPGTSDEAEDASRALRSMLGGLPRLTGCEHLPRVIQLRGGGGPSEGEGAAGSSWCVKSGL